MFVFHIISRDFERGCSVRHVMSCTFNKTVFSGFVVVVLHALVVALVLVIVMSVLKAEFLEYCVLKGLDFSFFFQIKINNRKLVICIFLITYYDQNKYKKHLMMILN